MFIYVYVFWFFLMFKNSGLNFICNIGASRLCSSMLIMPWWPQPAHVKDSLAATTSRYMLFLWLWSQDQWPMIHLGLPPYPTLQVVLQTIFFGTDPFPTNQICGKSRKKLTVPPCFRVSQPQPRRICFPRHDEVPAHWIPSPILRQTKKVGYLVNIYIYIPIESPKTSWLIFKKNIKRSQIWMEIEFVRDESPWIYPSFRSPSLCNQKNMPGLCHVLLGSDVLWNHKDIMKCKDPWFMDHRYLGK